MPISLNNCDDAINEILDYEKLEEAEEGKKLILKR